MLVNAPKDRTLFNYNINEGWSRLAEFLDLETQPNSPFPWENKASQARQFVDSIWSGTEYNNRTYPVPL